MKRLFLSVALCLMPFAVLAQQPQIQIDDVIGACDAPLHASMNQSILYKSQLNEARNQLDKANADLKAVNDKVADLQKQIDATKAP